MLAYFEGVASETLPNITEDIWRSLNLLVHFRAIGMKAEGRPYRRIVSRRYKFKIAYLDEDEAVTVLGIRLWIVQLPFGGVELLGVGPVYR